MEIERPNRRTFKKQFTLLRCSAHNNIFREIAMRSSRCVLLRIFLNYSYVVPKNRGINTRRWKEKKIQHRLFRANRYVYMFSKTLLYKYYIRKSKRHF